MARPKKGAAGAGTLDPAIESTELSITEIKKGTITFCVLGATPLILHRMSEKAKHELLYPQQKTQAQRKQSIKHNPLAEYRASAYRSVGDDQPTRLLQMATAFKKALASVAIDIPGATKAAIGRLTYVTGSYVPIYGTPKLFMSVVRSSDMAKTPDIRTRCIVPDWAAYVSISYIKPLLNEKVVANLFASAGIMRGVGDWRPEKGSGDYGQFELVDSNDPRFLAIVNTQGREVQDAALEAPEAYDSETSEMLSWFVAEVEKRGEGDKLKDGDSAYQGNGHDTGETHAEV